MARYRFAQHGLLFWAAFLTACGSTYSKSVPSSQVAAAPVFTPAAGSYTGTQSITISDTTPGATIYYTTDGTTPTATSKVYAGPISIATNTTIQALASAAGYASSAPVSAAYVIAPGQTAAPAFSVPAGTYGVAQTVTITDPTANATIYYTTDGTTPTTSSSVYSAPLTISSTETLSAMAQAPNDAASSVTTATYTIAPAAAAPVFSPTPGNYPTAQTVTLSDTSAGAKIYYTTDGSTPTPSSTLYTAPIPVSATETITAIAVAPSLANSPAASGVYSINAQQVPAPVITPAAGSFAQGQQVTIADTNTTAAIYYTLDGTVPTTQSLRYTGPIKVEQTATVAAVAVQDGYAPSSPAAGTFDITSSDSGYTFKNVQIVGGGFVDGIVMHPMQQGLMYARTDVGGAYRWNSTTNQWVPLLDNLTRDASNAMGIESLAVDPSDPSKLYLAAGLYAESYGQNGAIFLSSDQGQTFLHVPLPFKVGGNDSARFAGERLSVDPNLGSHLYYGTRLNGLWESFDSGVTWNQSASFPYKGLPSANPNSTGGVVFEAFVSGSGTKGSLTPTVYVGIDDGTLDALYVTTDGGTTWNSVAGQPTRLFLNHGVLGPDGNLYLSYGNALGPEGVAGGAIWRYTPPAGSSSSGTWKDISPSPSFTSNPGTYGYGTIAVDPEKSGVIMATTLDLYYLHDDVFRSLDGGNSWIDLGGNEVRDDSLSPWLNFGAQSPGIGNWLAALAIDPFNSNHVLYGTGQTIWESTNAAAADATTTTPGTTTAGNTPTSWTVGAQGIEETVIRTLASPPAGASLLSGMRDIGGFAHTSLDASPATGMFTNPLISDTTSIDFAQSAPNLLVRVGDGGGTQFGAYSTDSGATWTPFASQGGSLSGGGSVALAADGSAIVWAPEDAGVMFSTDNGTTWHASTGPTAQQGVVSDRVNPLKFYVYDSGKGVLNRSTDGGATFTATAASLALSGTLRSCFAAEGDLWLAAPTGLFHSSDSGSTFTQVNGPSAAYDIACGKAASGATYPALYLYGKVNGANGVYRSVDAGTTWTPVTDALHQYGYLNVIAADPNVFGRVYLGTSGRGIIYADKAQ